MKKKKITTTVNPRRLNFLSVEIKCLEVELSNPLLFSIKTKKKMIKINYV